ncbi:hypothetical protein CHUUTOTORO_01560 [Serratia phage vB_SmaM-ChuuTotoro]|nr:hypothetical protein CHUUTOTORO_01560 [Serratia phage vB_SmaM-ChuuTotoro]
MSIIELVTLFGVITVFLTFMHLATRKGDGSSERDVN